MGAPRRGQIEAGWLLHEEAGALRLQREGGMSRSRIALTALGLIAALQLYQPPRTNPPVESALPAPPEVQAILDRSCMDCHSHATQWRWYAYVAPISWLVSYDTAEGREHLNFSTWNAYSPKKQAKKIHEIWEEVEEGEMPLPPYVWLHPDAKLSDADKTTLQAWSRANGSDEDGEEEHDHDHG
jgi:hypothetical protein